MAGDSAARPATGTASGAEIFLSALGVPQDRSEILKDLTRLLFVLVTPNVPPSDD